MFITSTRIVGLIAVVCALIVAPQALAASSTQSRIAPPGDEPSGFDLGDLKSGRATFTAATPDRFQGNDPSGFDLGDLKNRRAVFTVVTHKSVKAVTLIYAPTNPGWGAAATAAKKSAVTLSVNTSPLGWFCFDQAKYEYVNERCD